MCLKINLLLELRSSEWPALPHASVLLFERGVFLLFIVARTSRGLLEVSVSPPKSNCCSKGPFRELLTLRLWTQSLPFFIYTLWDCEYRDLLSLNLSIINAELHLAAFKLVLALWSDHCMSVIVVNSNTCKTQWSICEV